MAQRAAAFLLEPFLEFPFVESRLDQAVLLAYLLTLTLRPQLPTAPLFCVSATTPGTGKGLLVEACNLLVRGRDAALMPAIQGANAEEETRKRITALLLQGVSSINLDNWTRPIGGEAMNALLTAGDWSDRVLGRSETVSLPARLTLAATGNNLSVRDDMTRRSLLIQLDAGVERPELRSFQEPNLTGMVIRRRSELLAALFTILKGYRQAGKPGMIERLLGRFEPWSMTVAAPLRWLGYPDPTDSQARLREADPEIQGKRAIRGFTSMGYLALLSFSAEVESDVGGFLHTLLGAARSERRQKQASCPHGHPLSDPGRRGERCRRLGGDRGVWKSQDRVVAAVLPLYQWGAFP